VELALLDGEELEALEVLAEGHKEFLRDRRARHLQLVELHKHHPGLPLNALYEISETLKFALVERLVLVGLSGDAEVLQAGVLGHLRLDLGEPILVQVHIGDRRHPSGQEQPQPPVLVHERDYLHEEPKEAVGDGDEDAEVDDVVVEVGAALGGLQEAHLDDDLREVLEEKLVHPPNEVRSLLLQLDVVYIDRLHSEVTHYDTTHGQLPPTLLPTDAGEDEQGDEQQGEQLGDHHGEQEHQGRGEKCGLPLSMGDGQEANIGVEVEEGELSHEELPLGLEPGEPAGAGALAGARLTAVVLLGDLAPSVAPQFSPHHLLLHILEDEDGVGAVD